MINDTKGASAPEANTQGEGAAPRPELRAIPRQVDVPRDPEAFRGRVALALGVLH